MIISVVRNTEYVLWCMYSTIREYGQLLGSKFGRLHNPCRTQYPHFVRKPLVMPTQSLPSRIDASPNLPKSPSIHFPVQRRTRGTALPCLDLMLDLPLLLAMVIPLLETRRRNPSSRLRKLIEISSHLLAGPQYPSFWTHVVADEMIPSREACTVHPRTPFF